MNNSKRILVVEDDKALLPIISYNLEKKGFSVREAKSGDEALLLIKEELPDLAVLDWMIPAPSGLEICKILRRKKETSSIPIILLTAKGEVEDRIKGLEIGADDYIGKPFEPKELLLRIKNIIKNNNKIDLNSKHSVGVAEIDLNKMIISLGDKNKKINISEKKVLVEMLANPGKTYSREDIGKISGISQERSIDVMITRLRQKLEINPKNPKYLQTIRGSGYVLWIE